MIVMTIFSNKLLSTIKRIFGSNNNAFKSQIKAIKIALIIFTCCYTLRVVRNTIVTIFWAPCFTIHRQLISDLTNIGFYFLSDWIAIYSMLKVHHKNFRIEDDKLDEDVMFTADDRPRSGSIEETLTS